MSQQTVFIPASTMRSIREKAEHLFENGYRKQEVVDARFEVSGGEEPYAVFMDAGTCTCRCFKRYRTCKHVQAIRLEGMQEVCDAEDRLVGWLEKWKREGTYRANGTLTQAARMVRETRDEIATLCAKYGLPLGFSATLEIR